jgi:CRP-like cAMP-binding protein
MARAEEFDWIGCLPDGVRATVLAETVIVDLPAGATIYERDAPPNGVYRLKEGRARQFFLTSSGREHVAKICDPVETIGDLAAIDGKPRRLFADTVLASRFEFLPIDRLIALRARLPGD